MTKRVLDVGNCGPDFSAIRQLVEANFDAQVDQAHHAEDAIKLLGQNQYSLVLVNRKLDCDYSDGIDVIRAIKRRAEFTQLPVMMITNLAEHHQLAMAAGAEKGFGKQALSSNETLDLLARFL